MIYDIIAEEFISIHAPRRERLMRKRWESYRSLFQSTLPEGSDVSFTYNCGGGNLFQSTLPEGSDKERVQKAKNRIEISIHAPRRERQPEFNYAEIVREFQSTLPEGSDIDTSIKCRKKLSYFNPRSPKGAT